MINMTPFEDRGKGEQCKAKVNNQKWKHRVFEEHSRGTGQVSNTLNVSKSYVQELCREGKLDCRKLPPTKGNPQGNWMIKEESIYEYKNDIDKQNDIDKHNNIDKHWKDFLEDS